MPERIPDNTTRACNSVKAQAPAHRNLEYIVSAPHIDPLYFAQALRRYPRIFATWQPAVVHFGKSAGGHFNPDKHDHGLPTADARHLGDLGNLEVGKDGKGHTEITIPGANLKKDDPHSYLGRAIIIHEKKDDGGQPTGNAGGRIGCGVIGG